MRLNIAKRTLIIIGFFSLLALAIIGLIIYPSIRAIKDAEHDLEQLHLFLERRYRKVAAVHTALTKVREIKTTVAEFPQYLFKHGDELTLITDLETLANQRGVTETVVRSNLDSGASAAVVISLSVSGDYVETLRYLADLERLPYFLTITRFQMSPIVDRAAPLASPTQATLTIELTIYAS